jgi:sodium-dependent phosphate cotransporter
MSGIENSYIDTQHADRSSSTLNQPGFSLGMVPQAEVQAERNARGMLDGLRLVLGHVRITKVILFAGSLFLFILAISFMKEGAKAISPIIRDGLLINDAVNSLGFGWLFAYLVMSGSPVAAASLAFFDAGAINQFSAFTMITGSRLGASFIVLFIGFVYVLRGRDRATSLSMGLLSLSVTGLTYMIGLVIGCGILQSGIFAPLQLHSGARLLSFIDRIYDPIVNLALSFLPRWTLFISGFGIILLSFKLFDRCLPQMKIKQSQVGRISRLVYRPWVMFIMGSLVTLISMSVSISLGILVPLSERGFVRRENVIPYIMGANITTFIDTLLAAVLLDNPVAFTIVLVEMISISLVSILILLFFYRRFERAMLKFVSWVTKGNRHVVLFMFSILIIPLMLMFF